MLAGLVLLWSQPAAQVQVTRPYAGVTYIDRWADAPRRVHLHVAHIDLQTPGLRFKVSPPAGNAPALNLDRDNRATIVHRDPSQPDGQQVLEPVTLWNVVAGSSQIVTSGEATVPLYRDTTNPTGLLEPGGPNDYSNAKAWADAKTARTAIGLSRDRRMLTLFTVDVRGGSDGMALAEVARVLIDDYGVWDALNLDGGGSTSMALADPATGQASLVNSSSDNPAGREVATSLAVFAPRRAP